MALPVHIHEYAKLIVDQPCMVFATIPVVVLGAVFYADCKAECKRPVLTALMGTLIVNSVLYSVVGNVYTRINSADYPDLLDRIYNYYIYPSDFQIPREPPVIWLIQACLVTSLVMLNLSQKRSRSTQAIVAFCLGFAVLYLASFIVELKGYSSSVEFED